MTIDVVSKGTKLGKMAPAKGMKTSRGVFECLDPKGLAMDDGWYYDRDAVTVELEEARRFNFTTLKEVA